MESFKCNFLMEQSNLLESSVAQVVVKNVERFGNWVGGSVTIDSENITFRMNAMNANFQKDIGEVVIPRRQIETVVEGKLMLFFPTVDIIATGHVFRFRLMGKSHKKLFDLLS